MINLLVILPVSEKNVNTVNKPQNLSEFYVQESSVLLLRQELELLVVTEILCFLYSFP